MKLISIVPADEALNTVEVTWKSDPTALPTVVKYRFVKSNGRQAIVDSSLAIHWGGANGNAARHSTISRLAR